MLSASIVLCAPSAYAQDAFTELFDNDEYIDSVKSGFKFGLLCTTTETYKSDTVVFIAQPQAGSEVHVPFFRSDEIRVRQIDDAEVIVALRALSYAENYVASFNSDEFMFKVGWRYSITSEDYEIRDWYIDRTTGGLGSFTESNATNDPEFICKKLEPNELADRLEEFAHVQISVVAKQRNAATARDEEKRSNLKF